jgi:hypothetical protein
MGEEEKSKFGREGSNGVIFVGGLESAKRIRRTVALARTTITFPRVKGLEGSAS